MQKILWMIVVLALGGCGRYERTFPLGTLPIDEATLDANAASAMCLRVRNLDADAYVCRIGTTTATFTLASDGSIFCSAPMGAEDVCPMLWESLGRSAGEAPTAGGVSEPARAARTGGGREFGILQRTTVAGAGPNGATVIVIAGASAPSATLHAADPSGTECLPLPARSFDVLRLPVGVATRVIVGRGEFHRISGPVGVATDAVSITPVAGLVYFVVGSESGMMGNTTHATPVFPGDERLLNGSLLRGHGQSWSDFRSLSPEGQAQEVFALETMCAAFEAQAASGHAELSELVGIPWADAQAYFRAAGLELVEGETAPLAPDETLGRRPR